MRPFLHTPDARPLRRDHPSLTPASRSVGVALLLLFSGCGQSSEPDGDADSGDDAHGTGGVGTGGVTGGGGATGGGPPSDSGGSPGSGGGASTGGGDAGTGGAVSTGTVLMEATFQERSVGVYTEEMVEGDFGAAPPWNNGLDEGRATIVDESGEKFLRITYPGGEFGPGNGGVQFRVPFDVAHEELYFSYRVRFALGFDFVKGGKLPGFIGGTAPSGCTPNEGGFSARNMWRTGGHAVQYVYYPDQPNTCGDDLDYRVGDTDRLFVPGTWHTVVHRIVMNTYGMSDGVMQAWVDGEETLNDSARVWRIEGSPYDGIEDLYFSTFFGGGDATWAPATDQIADFDDLIVSTGVID